MWHNSKCCLCRLNRLAVELHQEGVHHQCGGDHKIYSLCCLYFPCLLSMIFSLLKEFMRERNSNRKCLSRFRRTLTLWTVLNAKFILFTSTLDLVLFTWLVEFSLRQCLATSKLVYNGTK